jgi:murein DD-endopeptidase MepM/ murein hydrolase activator NlpD
MGRLSVLLLLLSVAFGAQAAPVSKAKLRRVQLIKSLKIFQRQSPVQLGRRPRVDLPKKRLRLWDKLLADCGRWASLSRGAKDRKLANRLAPWMEDQLALEKRRYRLSRQLHLRITEQIRFAQSRARKSQPVVIQLRGFTPHWPLQDVVLSSFFGNRSDPISGKKRAHHGVDFATKVGTKVSAVAAGVVMQSEPRGSYGELIVIRHTSGWESRYAHLSARKVKTGTRVKAGQLIALSGNSGRSTGPHLHLEIRRSGKAIDPLSLSGWR